MSSTAEAEAGEATAAAVAQPQLPPLLLTLALGKYRGKTNPRT